MKHLYSILLTLCLLLPLPTLGQPNPNPLGDALALENRGDFETAAKSAKAAIDSGRLSGIELGRGYIILATAWQGAGDLANAQVAFECALHILEHDREHPEDYASALEDYAWLYSELGRPDLAAPMLRKSLHLRQSVGDHAGAALSLTRLTELALTRNRLREAQRYLQKASNEAMASRDFTDDDEAFFQETQGWLAIAEHHAPAAVASYECALKLVERSRGEQHWLVGWERMLLGKAYAQSGDFRSAVTNMQGGLTILDHALGQKNQKYIAAELAYSRVLDQFGLHGEAAQMRDAAAKASKAYFGAECVGCTISVAAFR